MSPDTASTVTDLVIRPLSILFVVIVALIVARYGAKVIRRLLERVANQAATRSGSPRAGARVTTMSGVMANVWRFFVFVVAGAIVLGMLGINLTPLLASATIIGATLGFGAQQIVRDYFSGILMTMEDQYNVGDSVTVGGVTGVVEDVTMRLTRFRGVDGTIYVIPNGDIRLVGNLSRGWARAVVDLTLPGATAADLDSVRRVIGEAAHRVADATRVRRALHRAAEPRRAARRRLVDHHDARHAAHRAVTSATRSPARCARRRSQRWRRRTLWPADVAPPAAPAHRRLTGPSEAGAAQASLGLAASAASHMASTGGSRPVHSTSCAAAWCTSMPSPSSTVAPPSAATASQRRRAGCVDQVGRHLPGLAAAPGGTSHSPGPRRRPGRPRPSRPGWR